MTRGNRNQAVIDAEAGDWLVRREESAGKADAAFDAWLQADPRHGAAYDALSQAWEDLGRVEGLEQLVEPVESPRSAPVPRPYFAKLAAAFLAAAAMIVAVIAIPMLLRQPDARFATQVGEIRAISLPDGSKVTLGARSQLDMSFSETERHLTLRSGAAFFEVAHDAARPFLVTAGDTIVRAIGTKFDVRRGQERVHVDVLEGVVEVRDVEQSADDQQATRIVRAGQRAEVVQQPMFKRSVSVPVSVAAGTPMQAGAWRDGRLAYDDARLGDLVADVNRYYAPGVRLTSSETSDLRITTSFRVEEIPVFLNALGTALPVDVERAADGEFRLSAHETSALEGSP